MSKLRLRSDETVEEVDWLLGGGMSPFQVCDALERTPAAIYKAAWRQGRKDLAVIFGRKELTGRQQ